MTTAKSWDGWAVVIGERLRCVFAANERDVAKNEASRWGDAEVVRGEVRRKPRRRTKAAKR